MKPVSFVRTSIKRGREHEHNSSTVCATCRYTIEDTPDCAFGDDYKNPLSLDTLLVQHPAATYFVEVGNKEEAVNVPENKFLGVTKGDILTIDIDSIHTTAAKGLTVYMAVRED